MLRFQSLGKLGSFLFQIHCFLYVCNMISFGRSLNVWNFQFFGDTVKVNVFAAFSSFWKLFEWLKTICIKCWKICKACVILIFVFYSIIFIWERSLHCIMLKKLRLYYYVKQWNLVRRKAAPTVFKNDKNLKSR